MFHLINKSAKIIREKGFKIFARKLLVKYIYFFKKIMRRPSLHMRRINLDSLENLSIISGYQIRTFQAGDENTWNKIMDSSFGLERELWHPTINELANSREFDPGSVFFIEHKGRPVGAVCALGRLDKGKRIGIIHMLGVIPEQRGKGLGRILVLHALHFFREKCSQEVYLETEPHRLSAIKTYLSLGFKPIYLQLYHERIWKNVLKKLFN